MSEVTLYVVCEQSWDCQAAVGAARSLSFLYTRNGPGWYTGDSKFRTRTTPRVVLCSQD